MSYKMGWPLGRVIAKLGIHTTIRVDIIRDREAGVYVATSPDVEGLVLEAETIEGIVAEANEMIPALLDAQGVIREEISFRYNDRAASLHNCHA